MRETLLAYREWSGLGDWIMAMSVLKMVNQQYPHIDITLNLAARNKFGSMQPDHLPPIVEEVARGFDVKIDDFTYYIVPQRASINYDYCSGHMTYAKDGNNFIENMVKKFNYDTDLNVIHDPKAYAQYIKGDDYDNSFDQFKPYVLIQSCSKRKCRVREGKDFGYGNMEVIARQLMRNGINVIQIGQNTDYKIPKVPAFLSVDLNTIHKLMINSEGFIGMDGGLGVFASHHGVRQYIIYEDKVMFSWTKFPHRRQLDGDMGWTGVFNYILSTIEEDREYEKSIRKDYLQAS
jgi:hypothetical protein